MGLYAIRIKARLGATALSAFPSMASQLNATETVLTGWLEDRSALFGVLAQIEALDLQLLALRRTLPDPQSPQSGDEGERYRAHNRQSAPCCRSGQVT